MKKIVNFLKNLNYKQKNILVCCIVGIIPLIIMGTFCYFQTIRSLLAQEETSLNSAIDTASNSLDYQISLYNVLLNNLAATDTIIESAELYYSSKYDRYEQLTIKLDSILRTVYYQHPEIQQIVVYTSHNYYTHGKQFRPISDLEDEDWYNTGAVKIKPSWHINQDGTLCLIQKLPMPYYNQITSYSDNYISIELKYDTFFHILDRISNDYHMKITSNDQIIYEFLSPSIDNINNYNKWISLSSYVSNSNWLITLEKPSIFLSAPANSMAKIIFLIIAVCLFLIIILSELLSNIFVKRIKKLQSYIYTVKGGNFNIEIHDDTPDEIGELANDFQSMSHEINRLIQEDYKNKTMLRESQLKALQAQINPHFLYNCLSIINSRALLNNQPEISQMSLLLSTFYHTTLNKGCSTNTIKNEISNVVSYIDIQNIIHDQIFDVIYQIDNQLPEIQVPHLLLQPLVENAIIHGILPNKLRGKLFLTVSHVGNLIQITIMDNGVGIPSDLLLNLTKNESSGYGLKNVHERLKLTYGEKYGLTISSILGEGTMITFSLPIQSLS